MKSDNSSQERKNYFGIHILRLPLRNETIWLLFQITSQAFKATKVPYFIHIEVLQQISNAKSPHYHVELHLKLQVYLKILTYYLSQY